MRCVQPSCNYRPKSWGEAQDRASSTERIHGEVGAVDLSIGTEWRCCCFYSRNLVQRGKLEERKALETFTVEHNS